MDKEMMGTLKGAIVSMFSAMVATINIAIEKAGFKPSEYHISVYPFSIERLDKKPVEKAVLNSIRTALSH